MSTYYDPGSQQFYDYGSGPNQAFGSGSIFSNDPSAATQSQYAAGQFGPAYAAAQAQQPYTAPQPTGPTAQPASPQPTGTTGNPTGAPVPTGMTFRPNFGNYSMPAFQNNGGGWQSPAGAFQNPTLNFSGDQPFNVTMDPGLNPLGNMFPNAPNPYTVGTGEGAPNFTDTLRNLMNQSGQAGLFGQQAIGGAMQPIQGLAAMLSGQLGGALGTAQQAASNLPYSLDWSGQAATGALSTQNALVQNLLGQSQPTMGAIQGLQGQGLNQGAQNMLDAVGGRITDPLQQLMNGSSFTNQNPGAVGGTGLGTRAEDMLTAISGAGNLGGTLGNLTGLFGQGLNPATQAALQTQAADQTAAQYNNAKQSVMTQLLNSGAMGGDVNNAGAGTAQIVNQLGGLANAQQTQQSNLQQQAILANQNAIQQNYGNAIQGLGLGGQLASSFAGLEQGGANVAGQLGLGAAQTMGGLGGEYTNMIQNAGLGNNQLALSAAGQTGNLASSLGSIYGQNALGFGGLANQFTNTALNYPLPYMQGTQASQGQLLGGAQSIGQMGLQGVQGMSDLTGPYAAVSTGNSGLLGSILGSVGGLLGGLGGIPGLKSLGGLGGGGGTLDSSLGSYT